MRKPYQPLNPKPKKAVEFPSPRKLDIERLLCEAISKERLVSLRYTGDIQNREFEPGVVYHSSKDSNQVNVGGCQIADMNSPGERMKPHVFEVGKIIFAALTEKPFMVRDRIDPHDARYRNGIICRYDRPW